MRLLSLIASTALFLMAASFAQAQEISARTPNGQATVETTQTEGGVRLSISVAGTEPQVFDGVGDALVPLKAGPKTGPVVALDIDRDGVDEIFVRTSAQQRGVLIVFRWDAATNEYAPVNFAEDTGAPKPYLIVHATQPVSVNGGVVEVNFDSNDGGRKRLRVFRYRWNGAGFTQTTDN